MDKPNISGELVEILGPTPDDWDGLGKTYTDALLVRYPDGEIGSAPREYIRNLPEEFKK